MLRYTPEGGFVDAYATGLRNSAGFDWSPATGVLYATENGRDMLGDDFPPCELNAIVEGGFYGWPFANGANVPDPDLGPGSPSAIDAIRAKGRPNWLSRPVMAGFSLCGGVRMTPSG